MSRELNVGHNKHVVWTDSQCVLNWIKSKKPLSVFVQNRINEVNKSEVELRYINTKDNPADIPSRGLTAKELKESTFMVEWTSLVQERQNFLAYMEHTCN